MRKSASEASTRRGNLTQSYGSTISTPASSCFRRGFLPADDPRIRGTVAAIEKDLR